MRQLLLTAAAGLGAAGAIVGWIDGQRTLTSFEQDAEAWTPSPARSAPAADLLATRLLETGQFTGPARPSAGDAAGAQAPAAPVFPSVIATASLDGKIAVTFRLADGALKTVSAGDEIDGAWKIESASLERIVLSRNGALTELTVFPGTKAGG